MSRVRSSPFATSLLYRLRCWGGGVCDLRSCEKVFPELYSRGPKVPRCHQCRCVMGHFVKCRQIENRFLNVPSTSEEGAEGRKRSACETNLLFRVAGGFFAAKYVLLPEIRMPCSLSSEIRRAFVLVDVEGNGVPPSKLAQGCRSSGTRQEVCDDGGNETQYDPRISSAEISSRRYVYSWKKVYHHSKCCFRNAPRAASLGKHTLVDNSGFRQCWSGHRTSLTRVKAVV